VGQIIFPKKAVVGRFGGGLFLVGIGVFLNSVVDSRFGPIALASIAGGIGVAVLLAVRQRDRQQSGLHQDPGAGDPPPPIEPR